jgi:predicted phage tail protein
LPPDEWGGYVEVLGAVVTSIVLICAVLASLAVGVLVAYGVCIAMFGLFQMHARQVAGNVSQRAVAQAPVIES